MVMPISKRKLFQKYIDEYKQSNLGNAIILTIFFAFFLSIFAWFILSGAFFEATITSTIVTYVILSLYVPFISGVLSLNTGVTKYPTIKTWKFFVKLLNNVNMNYERIYQMRVDNIIITILYIVIRLPLYILNTIAFILLVLIIAPVTAFVAIFHATILAIPAYYIAIESRKV